jgi:hypothetical protein
MMMHGNMRGDAHVFNFAHSKEAGKPRTDKNKHTRTHIQNRYDELIEMVGDASKHQRGRSRHLVSPSAVPELDHPGHEKDVVVEGEADEDRE